MAKKPKPNRDDEDVLAPEPEKVIFNPDFMDEPDPPRGARVTKPTQNLSLESWLNRTRPTPNRPAPRLEPEARPDPEKTLRHFLARSYPGHERPRALNDVVVQSVETHLYRALEKSPYKVNTAERIAILQHMAAQLEQELGPSQQIKLPMQAPLKWTDRDLEAKHNPAEFTRSVYSQWIGRGLTRRGLRNLDSDLYHALGVWESRHPEDRIADLPTTAEVLDQKIASLSSEFSEDELRKLGTALQTRLRRKQK